MGFYYDTLSACRTRALAIQTLRGQQNVLSATYEKPHSVRLIVLVEIGVIEHILAASIINIDEHFVTVNDRRYDGVFVTVCIIFLRQLPDGNRQIDSNAPVQLVVSLCKNAAEMLT